jgi:RND family efflux transporter MFP subunit
METMKPKLTSFCFARTRGFALRWVVALLVLVALGAALLVGLLPRLQARDALKRESQALNVPTVSVIQPKPSAAAQELILPGNVEAYTETPIYARTNGYLRRWTADIGARVNKGQLLAEIETPEVDAQLQQAHADLATAQANYELAKKTTARWQELERTNFVSKEAVDQTIGAAQARKAEVESARANVARLERLQGFQRVYAPFDGVITARNIDIGALIDAGGGQGKALFRISAADRLRVYIQVPQTYSHDVQPGLEAELTFAEFPGRRFPARVVRNAQAIDRDMRTMTAEVEVDNRSGELLPGAYAQVHLKLKQDKPALILPANTLLFRPEGVQVGVVGADQRVVLKTVAVGRDFGTEVEVVSGLEPSDQVIVNPADSLSAGAQVRVVKAPEKPDKPEKKPG